jgi:uncharacterized protein (TIGR03000 family)
MYSVVMMAALTSAPDVPSFNGYFRDLFSRDNGGCNGCNGMAKYSCSGGCSGSMAYNSCSGCTGCNGCNGGSIFGLGDRVRRWFDRDNNGCCGGRSYACSGYSCSGFAYSCSGGPAYPYTPMNFGGVPHMAPGIPYAVPDPAPGMAFRPAVSPAGALASNGPTARASVIVRLPADARLFADGRQLNLTGAERKFVSPDLPTDQEFAYRFRAEYERNGEVLSVTKTVTVRGGSSVAVEFVDMTAAKVTPPAPAGTPTGGKPTAQEPVKVEPPVKPAPPAPAPVDLPGGDRATITVKLPPGATLYVDDRKSPSQDPVRSFSTPVLPNGREFAYTLKAELVRNGQPETLTQKVPFRAGERVTVDFTSLGK